MPFIFARQPAKTQEPVFFGRAAEEIPLPDLTEIQKISYRQFFEFGLKDLFAEISPIKDFTGRDLELWFDEHYFDEPKFDEVTSREKQVTYEAPLRVKARLLNKRTGDSKVQEVYLGDLPLMTPRGTFIINGVERTVVSQLIRSAGVFFTSEWSRGRRLYGAKLIPNRGAWLEFETDASGVIWVKIDRKRKVAVTSLLRVFGCSSTEEIKGLFTNVDVRPDFKYMDATLAKDAAKNTDDGFIEVYKRIRPGDLATVDNARSLIEAMFFNFDRYDLGDVGRYKFLQKFGRPAAEITRAEIESREARTLHKEDLVLIIRELIRLNVSQDQPDDIDHLGNRRVRAVGELTKNRFRVGLTRMERITKDRMSTMEVTGLSPARLINARPVIGAVREFFMSSQLSQFMDQTNPLAELEHKRRLSAMGPGGLSRERAGFDVRDVHPTHYGRICPIATPEGPNIGLVGHLASYARINEYGFIETPYRKVVKAPSPDGSLRPKVTDEVVYLNAFAEEKITTTPVTSLADQEGYLMSGQLEVRKHGEPGVATAEEVEYVDVSSTQIVSIGTALIPFLEHDDAVRALMGTNMQRQAVPCVKPEAPLVGTGVEARAAYDAGHLVISPTDGVVKQVDGGRVVIEDRAGKTHEIKMTKFLRSNASTCINQVPFVSRGDQVKAGQPLADGPAMDHGELSLGQNMLVAFMAWDGYNYEDAVVISERVVHKDRFTSIHIEHYQIDVRETKLGPEVVTSDIPNIAEEKLKNLNEQGIVRLGANVVSGDILVGKITPKDETELSAEERLLRAIFGEKARDVRDSSLYLEHGEHGKVVDVKIFSAEEGDKLSPGVTRSIQVAVADMRKLQVGDKVAGRHGNKGVISKIVPVEDLPFLSDGTPADVVLSPMGVVSRMNLGQILETHLGLAANALGFRAFTPALNGPPEQAVRQELTRAGFSEAGQTTLYDGRTGEKFDHEVTVGYLYIMKLVHMVEDKIHQRSIGPYSLITQQPLGGKAQFGGQRFGEMEVWALEAYGAAHTLQEILTIKSDDVTGRSKAYEAIIKGEPVQKKHVPEAFQVLVRELKGLGLDVELLKDGKAVSTEGAKNKEQRSKIKKF